MLPALLALTAGGCTEPGPPQASLSVAEAMAGDTAGYMRAVEPRDFVFPADHGPHPGYRTEWWYFTGNLITGAGRDFGFQLTLFRNALRPDPPEVASDWATRQAYMGHFAVTDIAGQRFSAFERFDRGALRLAGAEGDPLRVWIGDWEVGIEDRGSGIEDRGSEIEDRGSENQGSRVGDRGSGVGDRGSRIEERRLGIGPGPWTREGTVFRVRASEGDVAIDLRLAAAKPVVLQGVDGLSEKGPEPGNASYYYSLTRLETEGTVTAGGESFAVRGFSWLDREWSTSALSPGLVGWDWFALQLDDGVELMVYRLRRDDGGTAPFSAGTFVRKDGSAVRLGADDFVLEPTGTWTSPRGGRYPSGWRVRVPALRLDLAVTPRLRDQELDLAFRYWEGAVAVEGRRAGASVAGRGYVELTGYTDQPRP